MLASELVGVRAIAADVAARGPSRTAWPSPCDGYADHGAETGDVRVVENQIVCRSRSRLLPMTVTAAHEAGGVGRTGVSINPAPYRLAGRWSFFGRHAEDESTLGAYRAGTRACGGQSAVAYVSIGLADFPDRLSHGVVATACRHPQVDRVM